MIQRHTCDNGLRIVTERIPSVRSVALGIWVGTGSKYENEKNNGISHFLEHMFLKAQKLVLQRKLRKPLMRLAGT